MAWWCTALPEILRRYTRLQTVDDPFSRTLLDRYNGRYLRGAKSTAAVRARVCNDLETLGAVDPKEQNVSPLIWAAAAGRPDDATSICVSRP
jgi:hypothetical protein